MTRLRFVPLVSRAFAIVCGLVVAGCGGGGGGGSTPTPSNFTTTASLTIVIPPASTTQSGARKPNYISPNTTQIVVAIDNVNGSTTIPPGFPATTTIALKSGGNCGAPTATGETCTVQIPAPAGAVVYTFTILDAAGQPLATAKTEFTIVKGQTNSNLQVALEGIVASVKFELPSLLSGIPSQGTLVVQAFDASGALIGGSTPYAVPIVLTDTDATLSTHLELNSVIGPKVQVNVPSNVVTFLYNGANNVPAFAINATVGTATVGTTGPVTIVPISSIISFSKTTIDQGAPSDPNYGYPTVFFATVSTPGAPVTATTTASESGYSGAFTAVLDSATCDPGNVPVASLTPTTGTTFTITSLNPGVCEVTVNDTIGHKSVFWISVTTGVIGVNAHAHSVIK